MAGDARGAAPVDGRIVAVIVAAIAAAEGVAPEDVRLRAVRPAQPGAWPSLWALAGRQAQMARRDEGIWRRGRRR
ncbi:MAG: hypothetical protein IRZ18_01190 [Clostridia bacterium]|nr:hypothetical protein [Clostridia bacterium]